MLRRNKHHRVGVGSLHDHKQKKPPVYKRGAGMKSGADLLSRLLRQYHRL
ncbi:hypothetical protein SAMN05421740_110191, partial [Parapedobacter koreensis]